MNKIEISILFFLCACMVSLDAMNSAEVIKKYKALISYPKYLRKPSNESRNAESLFLCSERAVINRLWNESPQEIEDSLSVLIVELRNRIVDVLNLPHDRMGNTPLHRVDHPLKIERLLAIGVNGNAVNYKNETPLMLYIKKNYGACAIAFLKKWKNINFQSKDCEGKTVIDLVVESDDQNLFDALIKHPTLGCSDKISCALKYPPLINEKSLEQQKVEQSLTHYMHLMTFEESCAYIASFDDQLYKNISVLVQRTITNVALTRLHLAKSAEEVDKLLLLGVEKCALTRYKETPLLYMIKLNRKKAALRLLQVYTVTDCNKADSYGVTPLYEAIQLEDILLVKKLLEKGADIFCYRRENGDKVRSPLCLLIKKRNAEQIMRCVLLDKRICLIKPKMRFCFIIKALHHNNRYIIIRLLPPNETINTFFIEKKISQKKHHVNVVMYLMCYARGNALQNLLEYQKNEDPHSKLRINGYIPNNEGRTPLMLAARYQNAETVMQLAEQGINYGATDVQGNSLLHYASENRDPSVVAYLLQQKFPVNSVNNYGSTALHMAVNSYNNGVAELLIRHGANCYAMDRDGRTPYSIVHSFGRLSRNSHLKKLFSKKT